MKIKYTYILIIFIALISTTAYTQDVTGSDAEENLSKIGGTDVSIGVVRKFDNRYEGVKGSPFYYDKWHTGIIELGNDKNIEGIQLKYNVYEDELLLNKPGEGSFYLQKSDIKSFKLIAGENGKEISFLKFKHPKKDDKNAFYRVIFNGEIILLEYIKVVFEKADYEGGYSNDKRYDEFKKYPSIYYFNATDDQPLKLKSTSKGISSIFPSHNGEMKNYILENKFDYKNEHNLIQIMEYYQKIQASK